ncbi:MAG: zinc ribbon domain-containing protein, partial [Deltaproteobacteria bacterium]|nr:zinc ribbon domain-containing protein [Deltaproteobacteria bacterium]
MQCPQCEGDNKAGRKFCAACGHALPSSCAQCGFLNDPGDRFCGGCRAALVPSSTFQVPGSQSPDAGPRTSDLGLSSPQTADPGHWTPPHLAERIRVEQAALEARGATEGERKTVTALFADITNSMGLIEDLDPEEA